MIVVPYKQASPVGNAADDAFATELIEPLIVCSVGGWLEVVKPSDGGKGLSTVEKRPAVDIVAIHGDVHLEEGAQSSEGDTNVAIGKARTRLVMTRVGFGGTEDPIGIVPGHIGKASLVKMFSTSQDGKTTEKLPKIACADAWCHVEGQMRRIGRLDSLDMYKTDKCFQQLTLSLSGVSFETCRAAEGTKVSPTVLSFRADNQGPSKGR